MNTLGVPLGIFVAFVLAHLSVRKFAPGADPAILPLAFALSGIGIAFITRLAPDLAMRQVMWLFLGVVCMVVVLALLRNVDRLANYKYTLMIAGFVLLLSPMLPLVGQEINGSRIWLGIPGVISFQPGEMAKIAHRAVPGGLPGAEPRDAVGVHGARAGRFRLPDFRTLAATLLLMWGLALVIVVFEKDLGSALVLFLVFLAMLYAATGKKFYLVIGLGLAAVAAVGLFFMLRARAGPRQHLARPLCRRARQGLPDRAGALLHRRRRPVRRRHRARHGRRHPLRGKRLRLRRHRRRGGASGRGGRAASVPVFRHPRIRDGGAGQKRRELVHRRGHDRGRGAAGFHHRGWRNAAHPADRHHAALHQPGRLVASGKLHHRGISAALRRRRHGRGRGTGQQQHLAAHQQRAGTRVFGQTPDERSCCCSPSCSPCWWPT